MGHRRRTDPRDRPRRRRSRLPGRQGPPRRPARPSREISFTTARRAAVASVRYGTATASLCAESARATALAGIARHRVIIDRDRHRARETKARGGFRHARRDITTRTATTQISVCGPLAA